MLHKSRIAQAVLLACCAMSAAAQDSQRIEVTGSRIKRVEAEAASPVQVISRGDIEKTGKQSIDEVLRGLTADGQGSISSSFAAGFAAGSSAVSLRGLGVNSTLVLVNGRRMTTYGLADDGTRTFVDLNSIPLEVVDRIEVLKDGASAIYGADAVGGVVNVILRKSYTGASIGASFGQSGQSDGGAARAFGSVGFGDIGDDRFNLFLSLEASRQKSISARDRGFIGQSNLTRLGYFDFTNGAPRPFFGLGPSSTSRYGVVRPYTGNPDAPFGPRTNILACPPADIIESTGLCGFNTRQLQEVQPAIDRLNLFSRGTLQFSSTLSAYAELGVFTAKTTVRNALRNNNDGGVFNPSDPDNPVLVHGPMNLPAAHPDNPLGEDAALFISLADPLGRDQQVDNQVLRLVQGLQGTAYGWDFDLGAAFVRSKLKNRNFGFIRYEAMQAALDNSTYRITEPNLTDPSVLAAISPVLENNPTSSVKSIDIKLSRDLMQLPGGALGLALGAESRWEAATTPPVPFTDTAEIVGLGFSAFDAKRRVQAVFGELNAPVTNWLELSGALRHDRYSDVGSSTTPKFGFKLKPIDRLAIRGTYAEAFRAPGPAETGGSSFGFTSVGVLSQGNPNIKPETAKSYTLGLIAEPFAGLSATVDYWRVDREDEIIQADPNSIIGDLPRQGTPSSKIAGAKPGTFIYYDSDGNIATVTGFYENAAKTQTDGVDLELRHRMNLGAAGRLSTQLNWTHTNKYRRTDIDGNTFEYAGTHGPIVQSAGGGTPKDRISLALTWDRSAWAVTGALNYVGPMRMVDHKGETTPQDLDPDTGEPTGTITNPNTGITYPDAGQYNCGVFDVSGKVFNNCHLPSFTTFDVFARWTPVKNLDLNISIQNLFDRKAPFDPYLAGSYGTNYNQTWHQAGAVGRFFTVGAKYRF